MIGTFVDISQFMDEKADQSQLDNIIDSLNIEDACNGRK